MREAKEYNWHLNFGAIAQIFRGGCIIRAAFLQKITEAFDKNNQLENLLLDDYFKEAIDKLKLIGEALLLKQFIQAFPSQPLVQL